MGDALEREASVGVGRGGEVSAIDLNGGPGDGGISLFIKVHGSGDRRGFDTAAAAASATGPSRAAAAASTVPVISAGRHGDRKEYQPDCPQLVMHTHLPVEYTS